MRREKGRGDEFLISNKDKTLSIQIPLKRNIKVILTFSYFHIFTTVHNLFQSTQRTQLQIDNTNFELGLET